MDVPGDLTEFVARCADDPRVYGVAMLLPERVDWTRLLIATTWDGLEPISAELPVMAALVRLPSPGSLREAHDGAHWRGLDADGVRLDLEAIRVGDLTPDVGRSDARPLLDPQGLLEQWVRWRRGRVDEPDDTEVAARVAEARAHRVFSLDESLRSLDDFDRGPRSAQASGRTHLLRHELGGRLRVVAERLDPNDPLEADLARRVREATRDVPLAGQGVLIDAVADAAAARERFYALADAEGFRGDRPLFETARKHLAALASREPTFSQGFVLPTFDSVEARFEIGEAVGGCKPPLLPGVAVGVGVTPADEIEVWAAPSLRSPPCGTACVADDGARTVSPRSAGLEGLSSTLLAAVEGAHDGLPELIDAARTAGKAAVSDRSAALAALHLPRSFVAAVEGPAPDETDRLTLALAVARAGDAAAPLVARKLGFAAGRLLLQR